MSVLSRRLLLTAPILSALPIMARASADPAALAPVQALIAGLLTIMKQGRVTPFALRVAALAPTIDRSFDLDAILRASVGSGFDAMKATEQDSLHSAFHDYTIASYVNSFDSFSGQRFDVQPDTRAIGNGDQIVQTRIVPTSGDPHALDYVMRAKGGAWRVVDVLAEGSVSRVAVQRSDFRRIISDGGATALVASLRAKAAELGGA